MRLDAAGCIAEAGRDLAALVGTSQEALLGGRLEDHFFLDPLHRDELQLKAAGGVRTFARRPAAVLDDGGVEEVWVDISLQRAREEALDAFKVGMEHAPDGVFWLDRKGRFTYVNEQACTSLGYAREELEGLTLADIDPEYARNSLDQDWEEYDRLPVGSMKTLRVETTHQRKDGSIFPVEVMVRHRRGEAGHFHAAFVRDASAWRQAERRMHLLDAAIEKGHHATYWAYPDGRLFHVNEAACRMLGYTRAEYSEMYIYDVDPEYPEGRWGDYWEVLREAKTLTFETTHRRKDGTEFPVEVMAHYISFEGEEVCFGIVRDLSDERRGKEALAQLEARLQQAQKMEAIGRLAGGVAHDFNNMLGVIIGYCEMLKEDLQDRDDVIDSLQEIERAAQRSRDTTRQLLAFSRRQAIEPRVLDPNRQIREAEKAIRPLIREDIRFTLGLEPEVWRIRMDPTQLDQILVNLAVNARDAMPDGGALWIETRNHVLQDDEGTSSRDLMAGDYVCISVRDEGVGMDEEVLANAFEPFFTTKGSGRGTGLGLATVYGVVRQNGGRVGLSSRVGGGTRVDLFLPRVLAAEEAPASAGPAVQALPGKVVLVVEDEPSLRRMTAQMLRELGYVVRSPESAGEALLLCQRPGEKVDLVVSDVIMPDLHGPNLERAIHALRPELPFLFMSGYPAEDPHATILPAGAQLLQKPFSKRELAKEVAQALAGRQGAT
ncbi:MAG: PAS domain S-box protein [Myxococcales bacterium]|nr:PAS domain S-box protein [Myxococcales bacterium]